MGNRLSKAAEPSDPGPPPLLSSSCDAKRPSPFEKLIASVDVNPEILTYLTTNNLHCIMEASCHLSQSFGEQIKELEVYCGMEKKTAISLLKRRPGLKKVVLHLYGDPKMVRPQAISYDSTIHWLGYNPIGVVAEAMKAGTCKHLQELDINLRLVNQKEAAEAFEPLYEALADGASPGLHTLRIKLTPEYDIACMLSCALEEREQRGDCCHLRALEFRGSRHGSSLSMPALSPLLDLASCQALEELQLINVSVMKEAYVANWLVTTKAPHLHTFTFTGDKIVSRLCAPGVAPNLQRLDVGFSCNRSIVSSFIDALEFEQWPALTSLRLRIGSSWDTNQEDRLVEAIAANLPKLKTLALSSVGVDAALIMVRQLRGGAWPCLEDLRLENVTDIFNDHTQVMRELAMALTSKLACNKTLRRLAITDCHLSAEDVKFLTGALGKQGCVPNLECLDVSFNPDIGDDGVKYVARLLKSIKNLVGLYLEDSHMGDEGAMALIDALRGPGVCPKLRKVELKNYPVDTIPSPPVSPLASPY